mgnify:CR=1 FL=1
MKLTVMFFDAYRCASAPGPSCSGGKLQQRFTRFISSALALVSFASVIATPSCLRSVACDCVRPGPGRAPGSFGPRDLRRRPLRRGRRRSAPGARLSRRRVGGARGRPQLGRDGPPLPRLLRTGRSADPPASRAGPPSASAVASPAAAQGFGRHPLAVRVPGRRPERPPPAPLCAGGPRAQGRPVPAQLLLRPHRDVPEQAHLGQQSRVIHKVRPCGLTAAAGGYPFLVVTGRTRQRASTRRPETTRGSWRRCWPGESCGLTRRAR